MHEWMTKTVTFRVGSLRGRVGGIFVYDANTNICIVRFRWYGTWIHVEMLKTTAIRPGTLPCHARYGVIHFVQGLDVT